MSTFEVISLVFSGAGLLVLFFAVLQLRTSALTQIQVSFKAVSDVFLAHPELRPIFYVDPGAPPPHPSAEQRSKAETVAEMLLDIFVVVLRLRWIHPGVTKGWVPYIRDILAEGKFLRTYLDERAAWYPSLTRFLAKHRRWFIRMRDPAQDVNP